MEDADTCIDIEVLIEDTAYLKDQGLKHPYTPLSLKKIPDAAI